MQQLISQVNYLGTPPTITIDSGTAIGLLLLEDMTEQKPQNEVIRQVSQTSTIEQGLTPVSSSSSQSIISDAASAIGGLSTNNTNNQGNRNSNNSSDRNLNSQLSQLNSLIGG